MGSFLYRDLSVLNCCVKKNKNVKENSENSEQKSLLPFKLEDLKKPNESCLKAVDEHLSECSYMLGYEASSVDSDVFKSLLPHKAAFSNGESYPNLVRWFGHIQSFSEEQKRKFPVLVSSVFNS